MQDEDQLTEIFQTEEIEKIDILVRDLQRMRKINKEMGNIEHQIDVILEQSFFYIGDFIIENKFNTDPNKISTLWQYLKKRLS